MRMTGLQPHMHYRVWVWQPLYTLFACSSRSDDVNDAEIAYSDPSNWFTTKPGLPGSAPENVRVVVLDEQRLRVSWKVSLQVHSHCTIYSRVAGTTEIADEGTH